MLAMKARETAKIYVAIEVGMEISLIREIEYPIVCSFLSFEKFLFRANNQRFLRAPEFVNFKNKLFHSRVLSERCASKTKLSSNFGAVQLPILDVDQV